MNGKLEQNEKQIQIIKGNFGFGVRVLCNLSPEELKSRKKEVIENFLENLDLDVDFKLEGAAVEPRPSSDLWRYWSYFVTIN